MDSEIVSSTFAAISASESDHATIAHDTVTSKYAPMRAMSLKLLSTLAVSLVAVSSPLEAHAKLRPTPRQLQTYTQSADYVGLMLERVNLERAVQGLPALCANSKLQAAAQRHSDDQAANDFMDHVGSDGSTMSQRVSDAGYDWRGVAENVAAGQVDVTEVMDAWMNSEGHRHNILGDYTMLGAAYAYTPDGLYRHLWTQDFGRSDTEHCDDSAAGSTSASLSSNSSSSSSDNTMSAPNRRESRSSSSSISPPHVHVLVLILLTSTMLHLI